MLRREPASISNRRPCANLFRFQCVNRPQKFHAAFLGQIQKFTRKIKLIRFHPARADRDSLRLEKCVRHRPADQNGVGFFHKSFQDADLIGNFSSAQDDDERLGWLVEPFA